MDRAAVVAYRIEDGRKLLDRLRLDRFDVSAAFWLYTNDHERWELTIVSRSLDVLGIREAHMALTYITREMPDLRIDYAYEISLLEPGRPLARGMLRHLQKFGSARGNWIEKTTVNGIYVESAYLYPPQVATPVEPAEARN